MMEASPRQNYSTLNNNGTEKNELAEETLCQKFNLAENVMGVGNECLLRLTPRTCESSSGDSSWNLAASEIIDECFIAEGTETNNGLARPSIIYGCDKNTDNEYNIHTLGKTPISECAKKPGQNGARKNERASRIPVRKRRKNVIFSKQPAPNSFRGRSRGSRDGGIHTAAAVLGSPQDETAKSPTCNGKRNNEPGEVEVQMKTIEARIKGVGEYKEEVSLPTEITQHPAPEAVDDDLIIIEAPAQFLDHSIERRPEDLGFPVNHAATGPEMDHPSETDHTEPIFTIPPSATEYTFNINTEDFSFGSTDIKNFEFDFSNLSSSHSSLSIDFELLSMNVSQLESPCQDEPGYPKPAKRLSLLSPKRLTPVEFDRKSPEVLPRTITIDKFLNNLKDFGNNKCSSFGKDSSIRAILNVNDSLISNGNDYNNVEHTLEAKFRVPGPTENKNGVEEINVINTVGSPVHIDMLIPSEDPSNFESWNGHLIMKDQDINFSPNELVLNNTDEVNSEDIAGADPPRMEEYDSFVFRSISSSGSSISMTTDTEKDSGNHLQNSEVNSGHNSASVSSSSVASGCFEPQKDESEVTSVSVENVENGGHGEDLQTRKGSLNIESDNQVLPLEARPREGAPAGVRASIAPTLGAPPPAVATPPQAARSDSRCEAVRDHAAAPQGRSPPRALQQDGGGGAGAQSGNATAGLCWRFRPDGRLVFDEGGGDDGERSGPLTSRYLNKRCETSRLKPLEHKLKQAGITDQYLEHDQKQLEPSGHLTTEPTAEIIRSQPGKRNNAYDVNQNIVKSGPDDEEDLLPDLGNDESCEFDANAFLCVTDDHDYDSDDSDDDYVIVRRRPGAMRDTDAASKHNPDKDNLKSLLKKPGRQKEKRSNRVVFNETKNEFFDADYIILIREECCAEYDDEDDEDCDEPCTCNRPELVRLPCCEPGCGCAASGGEPQQPQPPSPKFAPPPEFVDAVALSPPEGYKDMEGLERRGGGGAPVCRECSQSHGAEDEDDGDGEGSQSDTEAECRCEDPEEREKTDQSQQTTPTTPPEESVAANRGYGSGGEMPTGAAQQPPPGGSPVAGILKGGRLWRQQTIEAALQRASEQPQAQSSDSAPSDDDCGPNRRSVRFIESGVGVGPALPRDECDGAPGSPPAEPVAPADAPKPEAAAGAASPDSTEMTLTFRLGHHVLISNNSLKPNSAVRQLFPGAKVDGEQQQYLVTAESLRAFEEAKRAKLPQLLQGEGDESIRKAIERNALRRSLIRYEARGRKQPYKADNSLVERIKQLTCDVDNDAADGNESKDSSTDAGEDLPDSRASPPGEEARNSPEVNQLVNKNQDKSFSPSSSSTTSSSSMSSSSTLNRNRPDNLPDIQNNIRREKPSTLPDIGGPHHNYPLSIATHPDLAAAVASRAGAAVDGPRRQFLQATLAPLTACVGVGVGVAGAGEEYYYQLSGQTQQHGDRASLASSGGGTEYSLEDIDEALREAERRPAAAPDVVAGTPAALELPQQPPPNANTVQTAATTAANDELAAFVKRDASRIERIRKKYQPEPGATTPRSSTAAGNDDDDEHDDYGFSRRPSVRGIKPRFGTTTEILQQIQSQLQQPAAAPAPIQQAQQQQQQQQQQQRAAWPYYSEQPDNAKRGVNQNYAYVVPAQYRGVVEEGLYQNCAGQGCVREVYRANVNTYSTVVRVGCNDYYASLPRQRNGRPQSPPPTDVSRQYQQTMVYIPYDRIEGYQPGTAPVPYYHAADYARVTNQNQINKRYIATPSYAPPGRPPPYSDSQPPPPPHHHPSSRGGSPLPGQLATARGTQTQAPPPLPPTASNCGYYQAPPRYRPMVGPSWPSDGGYATKVNRHSFPIGLTRYPGSDSASLTDSDSQHSGQLPNGFRQSADLSHYQKEHCYQRDSVPGSPTKPRFIERGVPEGAASVSPQDGISQTTSGTMTSPTSPQNPPGQKPLFYAMNV